MTTTSKKPRKPPASEGVTQLTSDHAAARAVLDKYRIGTFLANHSQMDSSPSYSDHPRGPRYGQRKLSSSRVSGLMDNMNREGIKRDDRNLIVIASGLSEEAKDGLELETSSKIVEEWNSSSGRLVVVAGHHRLEAEKRLEQKGLWRCDVYSEAIYGEDAWGAYQLLQHEDNRTTHQEGYTDADMFDLHMQIYYVEFDSSSQKMKFTRNKQRDDPLIVSLGDPKALIYLNRLAKDPKLCHAISKLLEFPHFRKEFSLSTADKIMTRHGVQAFWIAILEVTYEFYSVLFPDRDTSLWTPELSKAVSSAKLYTPFFTLIQKLDCSHLTSPYPTLEHPLADCDDDAPTSAQRNIHNDNILPFLAKFKSLPTPDRKKAVVMAFESNRQELVLLMDPLEDERVDRTKSGLISFDCTQGRWYPYIITPLDFKTNSFLEKDINLIGGWICRILLHRLSDGVQTEDARSGFGSAIEKAHKFKKTPVFMETILEFIFHYRHRLFREVIAIAECRREADANDQQQSNETSISAIQDVHGSLHRHYQNFNRLFRLIDLPTVFPFILDDQLIEELIEIELRTPLDIAEWSVDFKSGQLLKKEGPPRARRVLEVEGSAGVVAGSHKRRRRIVDSETDDEPPHDPAADGIAPIQHATRPLSDASAADPRLQLGLTETRAELMSLLSILDEVKAKHSEEKHEWTIREMGLQEQITRLERGGGDGRRSDSDSP